MTVHPKNMPANAIASATRRLDVMFPGYFEGTKHNHYSDFGWPTEVTFPQLYNAYCRNSIARAAVKKTARKTWETYPLLREAEEEGDDETTLEADIRKRFDAIRLWQRIADADKRGMVGKYSGLILRFADSKRFREPVDRVPGGLDGLVEIIPAWEGQLQVAEWDDDEQSETYGHPKMFNFNEAQVGSQAQGRNRSFEVHPDRVIIWSETGDVHDRSALEPGYNDLLTLEKIVGAGGEGFWKNAKSAPVLEVDKEARLSEMAQAMGVTEDEVVEALNEGVEDWQKGFDKLLMLQGMTAKTLGVTLPSSEHFYAAPLQNFAASVEIPVKILVGMQTGERASKEDADEWARTIMGRRNDWVIPGIMTLVQRLERVGILPERDWWLQWADLTEADMADKIDRADKMAGINQKMGVDVYDEDEIRAVTGHGPIDARGEE